MIALSHSTSQPASQPASQPKLINFTMFEESDEDVEELPPLHTACAEGEGSDVTTLIGRGVAVNSTDRDGRTPLHWACSAGYDFIVDLLIDNGADLNITDDDGGCTPLHRACNAGHSLVVMNLISKGADLNIADSGTCTPLHVACNPTELMTTDEESHDILNALIRNGANTLARDSQGRLPVEVLLAAEDSDRIAVYEQAMQDLDR
jgi:ankyrin repeat protein